MRLRIMAMHDTTVDVPDEVFEDLKKNNKLRPVVENYVRLTPLELTYGPESEFNASD